MNRSGKILKKRTRAECREATRARQCALWTRKKRQTRMDRALRCERRAAHRTRGLNNKKPAGHSCIRRQISECRTLVQRVSATQQSRKFRDQPVVNWHPLRREKLLLGRLGELRRRRRAQVVMMMPVVLRRVATVVIVMPCRRVPHAAIRGAAIRHADVPDGKKPADQSQQSENLMRTEHGEPFQRERAHLSRHAVQAHHPQSERGEANVSRFADRRRG